MPLFGEKNFNYINQPWNRVDAVGKVTGQTKYVDDLTLPGMLYCKQLRSPHASANVVHIDLERAKKVPGVHAVITEDDLPVSKSFGMYMYLTKTIKYQGDVVAIVAAESLDAADEALEAIDVVYETRQGVFNIESALAKDSVVHEEYPDNIFSDSSYKVRKGNVEDAFKNADIVLERTYTTQYVEHAYIEPEGALACQDPTDDVMSVYAPSQNPFITRGYVAEILGVPFNKVRIVQQTIGGSFGGKEEGVALAAARAAYLCKITGHPVKCIYSREESFIETAKRHPFKMNYRLAGTKDGRILGIEGKIQDLSGAYNSQTQFLNWRGNAHSVGAYDVDHVSTDIYGVFANTVHSGAFRGYSSPQLLFAQEQLIEEYGERVHLDPVAVRKINCLKEGSKTSIGQEVHNVLLDEIIDYHVNQTDFIHKYMQNKDQNGDIRSGIGMAICYRGCGRDSKASDSSGTMVIVQQDGSIVIQVGLTEMGQGIKTAYAQIAAEVLELPVDRFEFPLVDTLSVPDSGLTVSSRGLFMGGQSVKGACEKLKKIMISNAAELFGVSLEDVIYKAGEFFLKMDTDQRMGFDEVSTACLWSGRQLSAFDWYRRRPMYQDPETSQGEAFATYTYGCVTAEVEVDIKTGVVNVEAVVASHDVGTAINPATIKGQIYGGIVMGQGYALLEEIELKNGIMKTTNFDDYYIPTALDIPDMTINIFECDDPTGVFGSKSVAEPATEAVAAAIANAIYNATGCRIRNNPATLEEVMLHKKLK